MARQGLTTRMIFTATIAVAIRQEHAAVELASHRVAQGRERAARCRGRDHARHTGTSMAFRPDSRTDLVDLRAKDRQGECPQVSCFQPASLDQQKTTRRHDSRALGHRSTLSRPNTIRPRSISSKVGLFGKSSQQSLDGPRLSCP